MPASLLLGTITIHPLTHPHAGTDIIDDSTLEALLSSFAGRTTPPSRSRITWHNQPRWQPTDLAALCNHTTLNANVDQLLLDLEADYESLIG